MKKLFVLCLLLAAANILYSSKVWQIMSPSGEIAASVKLSDSGNVS